MQTVDGFLALRAGAGERLHPLTRFELDRPAIGTESAVTHCRRAGAWGAQHLGFQGTRDHGSIFGAGRPCGNGCNGATRALR
jgi:hypothetical protein